MPEADRIETGEEVGFAYVKVLKMAITQWNHASQVLQEKVRDPGAVLALLEETEINPEKTDDTEKAIEHIREQADSTIKEICLKPTDAAVLKLTSATT